MNCKMLILSLIPLAISVSAGTQTSANAGWVGIWHADSDGLPTGTLTLAAGSGSLGGTVVLDMLSREGGTTHVIASEPHRLLDPRVDGNVLEFQVKLEKPDKSIALANFTVRRIATDKATIHCTSCGPDAPVVDLFREH
jgi:hypothetical protein